MPAPPKYIYYKPSVNHTFVKSVEKEDDFFQLENDRDHLRQSYYKIDVAGGSIEIYMFANLWYVPKTTRLEFRSIIKNPTLKVVLIDSVLINLKNDNQILMAERDIKISPKDYQKLNFEYEFDNQHKYYFPSNELEVIIFSEKRSYVVPFYYDKKNPFCQISK